MPAKSAPKKSKQGIKRVRQTIKKTLNNRSTKSMIKTLIKKVESEVTSKSRENAEKALKEVTSALDKAGRKGVLHRNTASRKISRLTRLVNSLLPSEAA